jgi:G2F domain
MMQGLVPVGTAISWLFASPKDNGLNGFSLTGGLFNYTAEVPKFLKKKLLQTKEFFVLFFALYFRTEA